MLLSKRTASKPEIFEHNIITDEYAEKAKDEKPWFCQGFIVFNLLCLLGIWYSTVMISSRCIGTPNVLDLDHVSRGHRRYHLTENGRKNELKKLLRIWHKFATMHNIRYELVMGALIGKHRSNDFLDWDRDVDVMIIDDVPLCELIHSYPFNQYLTAPFDNIFLSSSKTESWMNPNYFQELDTINDYVLRVECNMRYPHLKRAIFGRLTHLYSGLTLEWWNSKKITEYQMSENVYLDEGIIENVFLPEQPCNISNVETFCPKNIEQALNHIYHNDLAPPYRETNWYKYYFMRLGAFIVVQCIFNYFYEREKYRCMELIKFIIKELAFVMALCLLLSSIFCLSDLADGAWCF